MIQVMILENEDIEFVKGIHKFIMKKYPERKMVSIITHENGFHYVWNNGKKKKGVGFVKW